jgi:simple sugar transport system ATP-binding protein
LRVVGVSKRYPGVQANADVGLEVMPGEIHGVLGENGAGKSTLMKIIQGVVKPDAGELFWDGRPVRLANPRQARALGIAMVFQHFAIFESLTVAENVWLGVDGRLSRAEVLRRVQEIARAYELDPDPAGLASRRVGTLSIGERQRVEILRALLSQPRLLILDEPTSVLTPQAVEALFLTLRRLASEGCAILYISHKLDEVRALCQRCTILRGGRVTGVLDPRQETNQSLAERMLPDATAFTVPRAAGGDGQTGKHGHDGKDTEDAKDGSGLGGEAALRQSSALEVRGLTLPASDRFGVALADIHFSLRVGEILGIAGISGSGQRELLDALTGENVRAPAGAVRLGGRDVTSLGVKGRRALGLRSVPEERIGRGSVAALSLASNTLLTRREGVTGSGFLRWSVVRGLAARLIQRFGVRSPRPDDAAASLSGGNLQKFIVGREIDAAPKVLLVAQPTWGLDVGAAAQIRQRLGTLAAAGVAVLIVSEDLEELLALCTDVVVMAGGRLSPRLAVGQVRIAEIGQWMAGLFPGGPDRGAVA